MPVLLLLVWYRIEYVLRFLSRRVAFPIGKVVEIPVRDFRKFKNTTHKNGRECMVFCTLLLAKGNAMRGTFLYIKHLSTCDVCLILKKNHHDLVQKDPISLQNVMVVYRYCIPL